MPSISKKFWIPALGALVLFVLSGYVSGNVYDSKATTAKGADWSFEKARERYRALPGGDLVVSSELRTKYEGRSLGFYRDIPLAQEQNITRLWVGDTFRGQYQPGASAELGSLGEPGTYGVDDSARNSYRIVWHHDTRDETIGFLSVFRVSRVAETYDDADLLRLRPWSDNWDSSLGKLAFTLDLPSGILPDVQVGPSWLDPKIKRQNGKVFLSVADIPAWQEVEVFVRLPRGFLGKGTVQKAGPAPNLEDSSWARFYIKDLLLRAFVWGASFLLFALLPALLWLLFWRQRLRDAQYSGDKLTYIPPEGSLVYGYALAQESTRSWKGLDPGTALVATLLDLVSRGYYERENVRDKSGDWRLRIAIPSQRPDQVLSEGEKATLDYFDEILESGPARIDKLDERLERGSAALQRQKIATSALQKDLQAGDDLQGASSFTFLIKGLALLWVYFVSLAIILLTTPERMWTPLFLFLGLLGMILVAISVIRWPGGDFSRITKMDVVGPWRSYRDFVTSFPRMEKAPELQAVIWDRAFAAALLYGVARDFAKQAQVLVDLPDSSRALAYTSYSGMALGNSLVSAVTPSNTSSGSFSSGGGGFSGGGGGFSGGGGGSW